MASSTSGGGIFASGDAAARGRLDGFVRYLGHRHPISWGAARGTGFVATTLAVRLPRKAIQGGRAKYRSWLSTTERTVTVDLAAVRAGNATAPKAPTQAPPTGPGLATVTDINTKRPAQAQPRAAATAVKGNVMAQVAAELSKHPVGKAFARLAGTFDVFDPGSQYRHAMLAEFAAEARAALDNISAALDDYARGLFALGLDKSVMAQIHAAVSASESVLESMTGVKKAIAAAYGDMIEQETSRMGALAVDGSVGTGSTGTAKVGAEIAAYYGSVEFIEGAEASQVLADLRTAQRGYAAINAAIEEFGQRLGRAKFSAKVTSGFLLVADDASAASTAMRRACRSLSDGYAAQLRHESKHTDHIA